MPIYEKEADRARERQIADRIEEAYGGKMIQAPPLADIDYIYTAEDRTKYNVEMRCRNHNWGQYPTVFLKAGKLYVAMCEYRDKGLPFLFAVWTLTDDQIHVAAPSPKNLHRLPNAWKGHTNRDDPKDMEWIVEIPIKMFKKI